VVDGYVNMDAKKIIQSLHDLERRAVPFLEDNMSLNDIEKKSGLSLVEAMRALQWLQNKGLLKIDEKEKEIAELDSNGKRYLEQGLPERRFLESIRKEQKSTGQIAKKLGLGKDELNACLGTLKSKAAIAINKGKELLISITDAGRNLLEKDSLEEQFLKLEFPVDIAGLRDEQRFAFARLKKRKGIVRTRKTRDKTIILTDLGKRIQKMKMETGLADMLTPEMLKKGSWKQKRFRSYDIKASVPRIYGGKRHFINEAIEYIRKIWIELGFKEMKGNLVQTSFWNFDALFTAQDHPVRDMHDTFYLKEPMLGKLPSKQLVERVRKTHENGWTTKSKGWQYKWKPEEARRNVMRTHTTCLSAQAIAALKKSDLPAKFFSVDTCFRNETVDWSHLFEFDQIDGIVVDPNANMRHLLGYLKEFFSKMGFKARIRPAYFPYTEPSAEVEIFDKAHGEWKELAGSGIFRPEVVKPLLGEDIPVLAWGMGLGRIITSYYGIKDLRDLYKNDLDQLRNMKRWLR